MRNRPAVRLTGDSARVFGRLRCKLPTLTVPQTELLALFSVLRARHANAVERLRGEGEVVSITRTDSHGRAFKTKRVNPWLRVAQSTEQRMLLYLKQLSRITVNLSDDDPMESLLAITEKDSEMQQGT